MFDVAGFKDAILARIKSISLSEANCFLGIPFANNVYLPPSYPPLNTTGNKSSMIGKDLSAGIVLGAWLGLPMMAIFHLIHIVAYQIL